MDSNDKYHVYAGFALGLHVADSVLRAEVGYRYDEIIEQLNEYRQGNALPAPSAGALFRRFPLATDDELSPPDSHPTLAKAASVVLDWHLAKGTD